MVTASLAGLSTGLALIVAIGAQNAYVLRQGLAREHVAVVALICWLSDVLLINAGVAGIGVVVEHAPYALTVVRWLGVAFLTWYGVRSIVGALHTGGLQASTGNGGSLRRVALRAVALTWLNPHVYLDTVVLLGSIGATHGAHRWWFAAGATVASLVWFAGLGYGARAAAPLLASPRAWQVLDVLIGLTMLAIAVSLARG